VADAKLDGSTRPGAAPEAWFRRLLVAFTMLHAAASLLQPMASYRALQLGMTPAALGLLATAFSVLPLLVAFKVGRMVDRRGGRLFMVGGSLLMVVAAVMLASAGSVAFLLVAVALLGGGLLTTVVAVQGSLARGTDERRYDQRFSILAFSAALGQLLGPAIGGFAAGQGSFDEVTRSLLAGATFAAITLALMALVRPPAAPPRLDHAATSPDPGASRAPHPVRSILRTPGLLSAIVVSTCILVAIDILLAYLPALGVERGWPASLVGALLAVRAAASMATRVALGPLTARFDRLRVLGVAMLISAAGLIAIPLVHPVPAFVLLMIAIGAGLGTGQPLTLAWVASIALPGTRATALSLRLIGNRVGQLVLPAAAGALAVLGGASGVLSIAGVLVAAGLIGLARRRRTESQSPT
jgi:MFS family permease